MTLFATNDPKTVSFFQNLRIEDRAFAASGALLFLSLAPTLAAAYLDTRLFQEDNIWLKPIKFQIALTIYLISLAFFSRWLPAGLIDRRLMKAFQTVVILCIAGEMLWIGGAAFLGTASHFNLNSPLSQSLYGVMGLFAVTLTSASFVWGVGIARNPATGLPPALHWGIALGLILTFPLTLMTAGTMASFPGHLVGEAITGERLWLLGWSREVGDLRASHFLATHAMHVIPVAALAVHQFLPRRWAVPAVWAASAGYSALTLWAFITALRGLPLI